MRDEARNDLSLEPTETEFLAEPTPAPPDLAAYAATQLFLHAARRVRPDLQPDADAARLVAHICRLVDGLPLAIELTAPWVRALPLADIARRLEAGLDLLATTQRDAPPRHRSMRAAFDHSWRLLSSHERSILRRLAVFRGGCTAEAAEAVAGATVLDLTGLIDKSWLRVEPSGRYDLHELVRQYCVEKLAAEHERESGEAPNQVRDRHCAYFAGLADNFEGMFRTPRNPDLMALAPELDNLHVAWLRAMEHRDPDKVRQLHPLFGLGIELGRYRASLRIIDPAIQKLNQEWEAEAEKATDKASTTALLLAYLYWVRAWQYTFLDQFAEVLTSTTQSLALLERAERCELWQATYVWLHVLRGEAICHLGDPAPAVRGLLEVSDYLEQADAGRWSPGTEAARLGWRAWVANCRSGPLTMLGRYEEAQCLQEQALALYQAGGGGKLWSAFTLGLLGTTLYLRGQYGEARQRELEALDIYQASGSRVGIGQVLAFLAEIEAASGEVAQAREHFRRSLAIGHAIDRYGLVCFNLEGLGRLELEMGRPARAAELYRESLAFGERAGMAHDYHTPIALGGLGRAALAMGDGVGASEYLRRSLRCPVYWARDRIEAIATMAQVFAAEGDVLRAAELLAFVVAHPATAHRVRQPMARLLAELEAELPAEQFAAAAARGRARELDEVVAEIVGG
jgi:tetratricopeptide (TPR) repeat protein